MIRLNNKENENKKKHLLIDFMQISFISWKTMIGAFVDKSFNFISDIHYYRYETYFQIFNMNNCNE